jgi:hypothetical protein
MIGIRQLEYSSVLHHSKDADKELDVNVVFYFPIDFIIKVTNGDTSAFDRDKNPKNINWILYCRFDEISYTLVLGMSVINNIQCIHNCSNKILTNILLSKPDVLQSNTDL